MIIRCKGNTLRTQNNSPWGRVVQSTFLHGIIYEELFCEVSQPEGFKKIVEQLKLEAE